MRNGLYFSLPAFLVIMICSSSAFPQERKSLEEEHGDVVSVAEKPGPSLWDASVEGAWLPKSDIRGGHGSASLAEIRAGIARRFTLSPRLEVSGGLRYALQQIDAPASARLPEALHAVSLSAGGEYTLSDRISFGVRVSPGLHSDFGAVTADDLRLPVSVSGTWRKSQALTLLAGVIYSAGSRSYSVLPMLGALYTPSDEWIIAAGFPRTGVRYMPAGGLQWHLGIESGRGEYRVHEERIEAEYVSYRDFRAVGGVEWGIFRGVRGALSGGYAFAREFAFYDSEREDLRLESVPFGRIRVEMSW